MNFGIMWFLVYYWVLSGKKWILLVKGFVLWFVVSWFVYVCFGFVDGMFVFYDVFYDCFECFFFGDVFVCLFWWLVFVFVRWWYVCCCVVVYCLLVWLCYCYVEFEVVGYDYCVGVGVLWVYFCCVVGWDDVWVVDDVVFDW